MSALGTELKFNLHLDPINNKHMSEYDFDVDLYVYTNRRVTFPKSRLLKVDDDNYTVIVNSSDALKIGRGKIKADVKAYIPDTDFTDGKRTEVLTLCTKTIIT